MRPLRVIPAPALALLGAALVAGCGVPRQTRRPGSDLVIVRRSFNPVEALVRTQCRESPAGPVVGDSLVARQRCSVAVGDSTTVAGQPLRPVQPPQRVP